MTTEEIQARLAAYQTGEHTPTNEEIVENEALASSDAGEPQIPPVRSNVPDVSRYRITTGNAPMFNENNAYEAAAAGWRESRHDVGEFRPGMDVEENRALNQSGFNKIVSGLAKGGVTAVATAVNTTAGTVFGIGSGLFELAFDKNGNGRSFGDTIDAGVNNWVSEQTVKLQELGEQWFPNYRTQEEHSDQYQQEWYKHLLNPNFIGDSILKNFGFTVGSIGGGAIWTKGLSAIARKALAGNLMKGAVAAANGDEAALANLTEAVNAIKQGKATEEQIGTLSRNINNAARQINGTKAIIELEGSALSAIGEGTTEGLMAKNEYLENSVAHLNQQYMQDYADLESALISELAGTDKVKAKFRMTPDGQIVSNGYELNDDGLKILEQRRKELSDKYVEKRKQLEDVGNRLASVTFGLNQLILMPSNYAQFARLYSGGFRTAKSLKNLSGGIRMEERIGENAASYMAPRAIGEYAVKESSPVLRTLLSGAKVGAAEAAEEMGQGFISSGQKAVADYKIAQYTNDGFDPESTGSAYDAFISAGSEYLKDTKNWQEGFLGALTGLFGMPGRFWKGQWHGGLIGAAIDTHNENKEARAAAEELNKLVNSQKFQSAWHDAIRTDKYNREMAQAMANDDAFSWHNADMKHLINGVMSFAKAGKLNDLEDFVDYYGNLSEEDAERKEVRQVLVKDPNQAENISGKEVVDAVKKRANEMKSVIEQYKDLYDSLVTLMPSNTSEDHMNELIFTGLELNKLEERFATKYGEVLKDIEPILAVKKIYSEEPEKASLWSSVKSVFDELVKNPEPVEINGQTQEVVRTVLGELMKEARGDEQLNKDIEDLGKIMDMHKAEFAKFTFLKSPVAKKMFDEEALNQEKVNEEASKQADKAETEGADSMPVIKQRFAESTDKGAFVDALRSRDKSDKPASDFVKMYDTYNNFRKHMMDAYPQIVDPNTGAFNYVTEAMLDSVFAVSENEDDYINKLANADYSKDAVFSNIEYKVQAGILSNDQLNPLLFDRLFNAASKKLKVGAQEFKKAWSNTSGKDDINQPKAEKKPKTPADDNTNPQPSVSPKSQEQPDQLVKQEELQPEKQDEQKEEKPEEESFIPEQAPEPEEEEQDSAAAQVDSTIPENLSYRMDANGYSALGYYQQSLPEVAVAVMNQLRDLLNMRKTASKEEMEYINSQIKAITLTDFVTYDEKGNVTGGSVETNPEFKAVDFGESYKWLKDKGAFKYIAQDLNKDDEVVFAIMKDAPKYEGKDQIVVAVVKSRNEDGEISELQPLTFLHSQTKAGDYLNLDALYDAIGAESVFGGKKTPYTSRVFGKRPGLVRYNKNGEKKRIDRIEDYDSNAPIIILDENNSPVVLRGNVSADKLFPPNIYPWSSPHVGRVYYMAKNGDDTYTPIFVDKGIVTTDAVQSAPEGTFLSKIFGVSAQVDKLTGNTNASNITANNKKLAGHIRDLSEFVNVDGVHFEYVADDAGNIALRAGWDEYVKEGNEKKKVHQEYDMAPGISFASVFDEIKRPVRLSSKPEQIKASRKYIDKMIADGLITSDAQNMRQIGANFLFDPWNPKTVKFERILPSEPSVRTNSDKGIPRTGEQHIAADAEIGETIFDLQDVDVQSVQTPASYVGADDVNLDDVFGFGQEVQEVTVDTAYEDLPEDIKAKTSKEAWESSEEFRKRKLNCR